MAHREGERLTAAWTPPALRAAICATAEAQGVSQSALVRRALVDHLLTLPHHRADEREG